MRVILAIATVVIRELIRRKDFYVLFTLAALVTLLAGSVNFFNDQQVARYVVELNYLLVMLSSLVIAVTTAARQLPAEFESRTILSLLAKPVTRWQVVAGKFLGTWLAGGLCLVVFYLFLGLMAFSKHHHASLAVYVQAAWLHWILLGVVSSMALAGSLVFAAPSSNATICLVATLALLGLARHLDQVALANPEPAQTLLLTLYYAVPHLEFFDLRQMLIHQWPRAPWSACLLATLYGGAYVTLFLSLAALRFQRKSTSSP
jgi:ABC-type transport system involved in multi-copper enzyme maturation permease subunit